MAGVDPYSQVEGDDHIKVSEKEDSEFMEFPKENDGTILLSTIQAQFPAAIGLKYKGSSGAWRAIRAVDNKLESPKGGWGNIVYCLTLSETNKRKGASFDNGERESKKSHINPLLQDMAVMGLPFSTTHEEMKKYFETNFGELAYSEIKFDRETGKSRGFGFICFKDELSAKEALNKEHYLGGRRVELRQKKDKPMKMFIGRLPSGTTEEELRVHFSKYGVLNDVYIPTPFRNFAFITYSSSEDGRNAMRDTHELQGSRLNVMERNQDNKEKQSANSDQTNFKSNYSFNTKQGGDTQNGTSNQPKTNMNSDLKDMLFQFLKSQ